MQDMYLLEVTKDKINMPFGVVVAKSLIANWLVGIATMMANSANDLTGKFIGVFLPIFSFASIGFEHCIANQFVLVMGWIQGANITMADLFFKNLLPATIGNFIGGAFFVGAHYAYIYGKPSIRLTASRF